MKKEHGGGQVGPPAYKPLISRPCTHIKGTAGYFYTPHLCAVSAREIPHLQDFMLIDQRRGSFVYKSQLYYKQSAFSLLLVHCSIFSPVYIYGHKYFSDNNPVHATFLHKLEWLFL